MEERVTELLERIAVGVEHLAEDPVVEIEAGPPVCPHCGRFNPEISVREVEAQGPIFEYVLVAHCNNCGQKFYAVPQTWVMFTRREEVEAEMNERRGNNGN
jgi:NMD protein affecting ribosome stability and mRNA decay